MNEQVVHSQVLRWLRQSILEPYVSLYLTYLRDHQYAKQTKHSYLCAVAHFAYWLTIEKTSLLQLGKQTVARFLSDHLPHCKCPYPVLRSAHEIHAALHHLLAVLEAHRVIRQHQNEDPLSAELASFDRYMLQVRGLAATTRRQRVLILRRFLGTHSSAKPVGVGRIRVTDLRRFVLPDQVNYHAGTVAVLGGALRCYLRFRALEGD